MLLRSLLFMPGNNEKILSKIEKVDADAVILDLEDGVPFSEKKQARRLVKERLAAIDIDKLNKEVLVRINGINDTDGRDYNLPQEDLEAVCTKSFDGLMIPKVNSPAEFQQLEKMLDDLKAAENFPGAEALYFIPNIETVRGVINVNSLLGASENLQGAALGGEDLALDLGARRTKAGDELSYARSRMLLACRAQNRLAIDVVFTDIQDEVGLKEEAKKASNLGYDGKLAIHPQQLGPINEAFTPSEEEIKYARRVVEAFAEASKENKSVAVVDGEMIDPPVAARARRILDFQEKL